MARLFFRQRTGRRICQTDIYMSRKLPTGIGYRTKPGKKYKYEVQGRFSPPCDDGKTLYFAHRAIPAWEITTCLKPPGMKNKYMVRA